MKYLTFFLNYLKYNSYSNNEKLVTVVVPLYNDEEFILETLESIERQTYKNFECIIVNDDSKDGSVNKVRTFIKNKKNFKLLSHEVNKGLSASRNTGLKHANGEYITFLDSDDLLLPQSIARRVEGFEGGNNSVVGVFQRIVFYNYRGSSFKKVLLRYFPYPNKNFFKKDNSNGAYLFPAHAPLLRANLLREHGGFDESMRDGVEDLELWNRLLLSGYAFKAVDGIGGLYRQKPSSMLKEKIPLHIKLTINEIEKFERCVGKKEIFSMAKIDRVLRYSALQFVQVKGLNNELKNILRKELHGEQVSKKEAMGAFNFAKKMKHHQGEVCDASFNQFWQQINKF